MSHDHSFWLTCNVKPTVTDEQLAHACEPILSYFGVDIVNKEDPGSEHAEVLWDSNSRQLSITTYGDVGYLYESDDLTLAIDRLNPLVSTPARARFIDNDTSFDSAERIFWVGSPDEIPEARFAFLLQTMQETLSEFVTHEGWEKMVSTAQQYRIVKPTPPTEP